MHSFFHFPLSFSIQWLLFSFNDSIYRHFFFCILCFDAILVLLNGRMLILFRWRRKNENVIEMICEWANSFLAVDMIVKIAYPWLKWLMRCEWIQVHSHYTLKLFAPSVFDGRSRPCWNIFGWKENFFRTRGRYKSITYCKTRLHKLWTDYIIYSGKCRKMFSRFYKRITSYDQIMFQFIW